MTLIDRIMEHPLVYRLWQAPFAARKLAPVLARQDLNASGRVLDVACGPGTNSSQFANADYSGIDMNERYIAAARSRHPGRFITADAIKWSAETTEEFDFILVNSFLHHLDDDSVRTLLLSLRSRLGPKGRFHILELVLPNAFGVARTLARLDRGKYARSLDGWKTLLSETLDVEWFEPYKLTAFGIPCWHMVYAIGGPRQ
jgi:SAM-dependent methyltransferase